MRDCVNHEISKCCNSYDTEDAIRGSCSINLPKINLIPINTLDRFRYLMAEKKFEYKECEFVNLDLPILQVCQQRSHLPQSKRPEIGAVLTPVCALNIYSNKVRLSQRWNFLSLVNKVDPFNGC